MFTVTFFERIIISPLLFLLLLKFLHLECKMLMLVHVVRISNVSYDLIDSETYVYFSKSTNHVQPCLMNHNEIKITKFCVVYINSYIRNIKPLEGGSRLVKLCERAKGRQKVFGHFSL